MSRNEVARVTHGHDDGGFDASRARRFVPTEHEKTAILVEPVEGTVALRTSFGTQVMRGPFYIVADGDQSYGAAQREFEATHERRGATTWVKVAPVAAYQTDTPVQITSLLGDHRETTVRAVAGDWIVRQSTGEVMVISPEAFEERYRPSD